MQKLQEQISVTQDVRYAEIAGANFCDAGCAVCRNCRRKFRQYSRV